VCYLDLRPGHQETDVLVLLTGQQSYCILTVLDLYAIDLGERGQGGMNHQIGVLIFDEYKGVGRVVVK